MQTQFLKGLEETRVTDQTLNQTLNLKAFQVKTKDPLMLLYLVTEHSRREATNPCMVSRQL